MHSSLVKFIYVEFLFLRMQTFLAMHIIKADSTTAPSFRILVLTETPVKLCQFKLLCFNKCTVPVLASLSYYSMMTHLIISLVSLCTVCPFLFSDASLSFLLSNLDYTHLNSNSKQIFISCCSKSKIFKFETPVCKFKAF